MESHIVKLNSTNEYFQVEYYVSSIINVTFTKNKKKATIFQYSGNENLFLNGSVKVSLNKKRSIEFSYYLHCNNIKSSDITVETFDAPIQPMFTNSQLRIARNIQKAISQFQIGISHD